MSSYTVAQFLALGASAPKYGCIINDSAGNISAAFGALFANPAVRSIIIANNGALNLPAADFFEGLTPGLYGRLLTISNLSGGPVHLQATASESVQQLLNAEARHTAIAPMVADSALNIAAALNVLNGDLHVTSIYVQDGGALNISASQYLADGHALSEIVSTTALNVYVPSSSHDQTFTATGLNTTWILGSGASDAFVFHAGFGQDTIVGHQLGKDSISFDHTLFANFAAMFSHTASDGHGNTVITYAPNETVTLIGVSPDQVQAHASAFHFI